MNISYLCDTVGKLSLVKIVTAAEFESQQPCHSYKTAFHIFLLPQALLFNSALFLDIS